MPPRRPSSKPGSSSGMPTGSRRASHSNLSRGSSSRKSQSRRSSSTAEPPAVEKSAADARRPVYAVTTEPAPRPDAAPAPKATSEAAASLAQRQPSTRRLSMPIEPTHKLAFDGTKPTREETKISELKSRTEVKQTTGERRTTTSSRCQVSITYNVLLAWRHAASVQAAVRQSVEDTLNMVNSVAGKSARTLQHLGPRLQNWTYFMLHQLHPAVWPMPPTVDPMNFQSLYGEQVDDGSRGFFGHWHSSREGIQRSFGRSVHRAAAQFYKLDPWSLIAYSPALKAVSVATAAFQWPLYYGAGTAAMRYGSLGFVYATQLAGNIDVRALFHAAADGKSLVAEEKDPPARVV